MRSRRGPRDVQTARKIVGYSRCSTVDQARNGVTLAAQEARIRAYALATGRKLDEIVTDAGISAKSTDRPGFKRILQGVAAGEIGAMLVLKIDRATRSVRDLSDMVELFAKHDCAFVSVTESIDTGSAAGRMITNLLGVLAQFEREQIGERTSVALAHKRQSRQVYGRVPFGYERIGSDLVPVQHEQQALQHIREMDAHGTSYRKIAAWLFENGLTPKNGASVWHAASVRKLLLSKMNAESVR
jgi:site-specific DNA recombinase